MKIVLDVIEKLYIKTKEGTYCWECLGEYIKRNENGELRRHILSSQKTYYGSSYNKTYYGSMFLDERKSYTLEVNNGVILLLGYSDGKNMYYILAAQRTPKSRVVELNVKEELQDKLETLRVIVSNKCDNIEEFLQSLIND